MSSEELKTLKDIEIEFPTTDAEGSNGLSFEMEQGFVYGIQVFEYYLKQELNKWVNDEDFITTDILKRWRPFIKNENFVGSMQSIKLWIKHFISEEEDSK